MNTFPRVVCFGEILWDLLPTGEVPGGAPMNVAYHLHKLGHAPAVITRVGKDDRGDRLTDMLMRKDISTEYIQTDDLLPTGIVYATPNEQHEMEYDIVAPVAWDAIEWKNDFETLFTGDNYFVFGSLIARNTSSRNTLFRLLDVAQNKVLDINLRPPHYNENLLRDLLNRANIVKLNQAEIDFISSWLGTYPLTSDKMKAVTGKFDIETLVVTRGGDGAVMLTGGSFFEHPGFKVTVQDTVGSGDSFLAAIVSGLIRKHPPADIVQYACATGALVTSRKGGWPDYDLAEVRAIMNQTSLIS